MTGPLLAIRCVRPDDYPKLGAHPIPARGIIIHLNRVRPHRLASGQVDGDLDPISVFSLLPPVELLLSGALFALALAAFSVDSLGAVFTNNGRNSASRSPLAAKVALHLIICI